MKHFLVILAILLPLAGCGDRQMDHDAGLSAADRPASAANLTVFYPNGYGVLTDRYTVGQTVAGRARRQPEGIVLRICRTAETLVVEMDSGSTVYIPLSASHRLTMPAGIDPDCRQ